VSNSFFSVVFTYNQIFYSEHAKNVIHSHDHIKRYVQPGERKKVRAKMLPFNYYVVYDAQKELNGVDSTFYDGGCVN
jgi:hypothetical protein